MTTDTEARELVERLTADPDTGAWDDRMSSYARGVEAADTITALLAENERLRRALEFCNSNSQGLSVDNFRFLTGLIADVSRVALKGADND